MRFETTHPSSRPKYTPQCADSVVFKNSYYLCEKSDGVRCLMYFTRDGDKEVHYLIDRKNDYYWVQNLHFPKPNDDSFQSFHTDTLIDGELVLDDIGDGKRMLRYLVFDCLLLDNKPLMKRMLDKRLGVGKSGPNIADSHSPWKERRGIAMWWLTSYSTLWSTYSSLTQSCVRLIRPKYRSFLFSQYLHAAILLYPSLNHP